MKHPILLVAFLLLPLLAFSQGVTFEQGSWKEALALAKQTNKPVMLYISFSDEEISRRIDESMNKYVFAYETVGDVCKTYFVCYRMDASKKEGFELAKKYGLAKRPVVLFVNADGRVLSIMQTSMSNTDFMEGAKKLLLDLKDPKPITAWEAEYPKMNKDTAFLLEYINKRIDLGLSINEAFDAYIRLFPANGPMSKQAATLFQSNAHRLLVSDYAFEYFFATKQAYSIAIASVTGNKPVEDNFVFRKVVDNTVAVATLLEDDALLEKAVTVFQQIPKDFSTRKQAGEYYLDYYKKTNNPKKYLAHARLFAADIMKKLDSEELLMKDDVSYLNLTKQRASETDSARIKSLDRSIKSRPDLERSQLCQTLNTIAWTIFETTSDKAKLKEALTWSEKTVQYKPTTVNYLDTNAQILYKLGRKEEAIALQKRAVANNTNTNSLNYTTINETLKKMEAGEKWW